MVYITYNMGNRDLPDIYAHVLGPVALRLGYTYQADPSCPCYNLCIRFECVCITMCSLVMSPFSRDLGILKHSYLLPTCVRYSAWFLDDTWNINVY